MQQENQAISDFVARTDSLARHLSIPINDLAVRMGISKDMMAGYRTGRYRLTAKAMGKLAKAEADSGFNVHYLHNSDAYAAPLKLASKIAKESAMKLGLSKAQEDEIFIVTERILTPALMPFITSNQTQELMKLKEALRNILKE